MLLVEKGGKSVANSGPDLEIINYHSADVDTAKNLFIFDVPKGKCKLLSFLQ
jgi:hypothetical protein